MSRIIILILAVALVVLVYMFFFMNSKDQGGGLVSTSGKKVGDLESIFTIYGPGKGKHPRFLKPMSITTDKENNIYVADSGHHRIVVFNKNGKFLFEFGKYGLAYPEAGEKANWNPGTFNYPYGIDIDRNTGNIFVADMLNKRIQIFNREGKFIDWFPKEKYGGMADDIFPTDIAVDNNKVYVLNPYQVVIFNVKGNFIKDFGMPGSGQGKLDRPNGIDIGTDGTIYVSDSNNLRLQSFTPEGRYKWSFGKKVGFNSNDGREFGNPRNISVGPDNNIYVADAFHFNIKIFSNTGKKLAEMGKRGADEGYFNFPNGIEVASDKTVYVVEKENNRIQAVRFNRFVIDREFD